MGCQEAYCVLLGGAHGGRNRGRGGRQGAGVPLLGLNSGRAWGVFSLAVRVSLPVLRHQA